MSALAYVEISPPSGETDFDDDPKTQPDMLAAAPMRTLVYGDMPDGEA